jgi:tRNA pseudouridine55 synthase
VFGIDTDSLDMQGKIINTKECDITEQQIIKILPQFLGKIKQYPPKVSALSINGVKAYELQRRGVEFDVPQREVTIYYIEVIRKTGHNRFLFKIGCSKGTYIRSICRDMASILDTYAYISYLNRTKNGYFNIDEGYSIEELREMDIKSALIPIDKPIQHLDRADIAQNDLKKAVNGMTVFTSKEYNTPFRVYCNDIFIGLGRQEIYNDKKYIKVFKRLADEEDF